MQMLRNLRRKVQGMGYHRAEDSLKAARLATHKVLSYEAHLSDASGLRSESSLLVKRALDVRGMNLLSGAPDMRLTLGI